MIISTDLTACESESYQVKIYLIDKCKTYIKHKAHVIKFLITGIFVHYFTITFQLYLFSYNSSNSINTSLQSSVELLELVPLLLAAAQVELLHAEGDGAEEDVLLELRVVPHRGLEGPAPHNLLVYPVFQHLHETGIAVLSDDFCFSFGDFCWIRMKLNFHVGIWLLLKPNILLKSALNNFYK